MDDRNNAENLLYIQMSLSTSHKLKPVRGQARPTRAHRQEGNLSFTSRPLPSFTSKPASSAFPSICLSDLIHLHSDSSSKLPLNPTSRALLHGWSPCFILSVLLPCPFPSLPLFFIVCPLSLHSGPLRPGISGIRGGLEGSLGCGHKGPLPKAMTHFQVKRTFVMQQLKASRLLWWASLPADIYKRAHTHALINKHSERQERRGGD